ncbi:MAG: dTDP-4-dehydrorhamnose 3,5-epimerase [Mariprofundaceae bacterium]
MKVIETSLPGVLIIEPRVFRDVRGFFVETWHEQRYAEAGLEHPHFVQDNHSRSQRGVLRGLHYQTEHAQGKLLRVASGEVFDVAVDVRAGSPTFGQWTGALLNDVNHRQMYIPPGFAHGFCVLSEAADFCYKCTDYYHPQGEAGVLYNDTDIGIDWPLDAPLLSNKDRSLPCLADVPEHKLPKFIA